MSNRVKPPRKVIDWFVSVGFEYKVNEQSIYEDRRDAPIHYFQSPGADGFELVSTILADDAIKIFNAITRPLRKRIEAAFGERCPNGHLRSIQPCRQCKKPDGRSDKANYAKGGVFPPTPMLDFDPHQDYRP